MPHSRDRAADIAKGIAILTVVLGHLMPIAFVPGNHPGAGSQLTSLILNAPYRWVFPTAVPAFYLISSIFYVRRWDGSTGYLWKRMKATALVLLFWGAIQYAWVSIAAHKLVPMTFEDLRVGGPTPFGIPVYYFLVDLLLLYVVMEVVSRLRAYAGEALAAKVSWIVVGMFAVAFFSMPLLGVSTIPYWSMWAFVLYPVLAVALETSHLRTRTLTLIFGALFVFGMASDVAWKVTNDVDPAHFGYARIPALAGAILILMGARALSSRHVSSWLETSGRYSLGLFVLHPFFMTLLAGVLPMSVIAWAGGEIDLRFVFAFAVVASTSIAVVLLARTPLRRFVTTERSRPRDAGPRP